MTLTEQVYAQALLLAGDLNDRQSRILEALCAASTTSLASRLREGLNPEDCKADFVASASLLSLAAMNGMEEDAAVEQITAGDLTIRKGSRAATTNCLRTQAELMMAPYMRDGFLFQGV